MTKTPLNFDTFFEHFTTALPQGLLTLSQDLEKNLRFALESTFQHLNLVTREEFDVQSTLLARTRVQLETLEARVITLEQAAHPADDFSE